MAFILQFAVHEHLPHRNDIPEGREISGCRYVVTHLEGILARAQTAAVAVEYKQGSLMRGATVHTCPRLCCVSLPSPPRRMARTVRVSVSFYAVLYRFMLFLYRIGLCCFCAKDDLICKRWWPCSGMIAASRTRVLTVPTPANTYATNPNRFHTAFGSIL